MALPHTHSWSWLKLPLSEHPVLKHTQGATQSLPESAETLPLMWVSMGASHRPPVPELNAVLVPYRKQIGLEECRKPAGRRSILPRLTFSSCVLGCWCNSHHQVPVQQAATLAPSLLPERFSWAPHGSFQLFTERNLYRFLSWKQTGSSLPFASSHVI